jgi:hypothetical protein
LFAQIDRRPTHKAERNLAAFLTDTRSCTELFAGQEFAWLNPAAVSLVPNWRGAELVQLIYRNAGSLDMTSTHHHIYRVWFEADIKDKKTGEIVRFPPRVEQFFEVDLNGKIVACVERHRGQHIPAPNLQETVSKACEEKGWTRRMLCDRGTERCYPLAQCERGV